MSLFPVKAFAAISVPPEIQKDAADLVSNHPILLRAFDTIVGVFIAGVIVWGIYRIRKSNRIIFEAEAKKTQQKIV